MNMLMLSRALGWFSLGLGAMEAAIPSRLSGWLGLWGGSWLVRAFGMREIAAGMLILAKPDAAMGPVSRVAGDALDLAVLLPALSPSNPRHKAARVAFIMVAGVTMLDVLCASGLVTGEQHRADTARRTRLSR